MANFQAYNDKVWTLPPIALFNPSTGLTSSTPPAGSSFSISSGLPGSLGVSMAIVGLANFPSSPRLTPLVKNSLAIPVTVSATGMTSATFLVDVLPDPNAPLAIVVDTTQADATSVAQAVPTAPGP